MRDLSAGTISAAFGGAPGSVPGGAPDGMLGGMALAPPPALPAAMPSSPLPGKPARSPARASSALPDGARGLLTRRCGPTGLAGGRRGEEWVLTIPPRWRGRADHLTGWWGGGDPLATLAIRFPSRAVAEDYARRLGLEVAVCEPPPFAGDACRKAGLAADVAATTPDDPTLPWVWDGRVAAAPAAVVEDRSGSGLDLELALVAPARVFRDPASVLAHPALTRGQKLEILARWEWDARLIEAAQAEGMPEAGEPSRLEEVLAARRALLPEETARRRRAVAYPPAPSIAREAAATATLHRGMRRAA